MFLKYHRIKNKIYIKSKIRGFKIYIQFSGDFIISISATGIYNRFKRNLEES